MVQLDIIGKHGGDKSQEVSQSQVCSRPITELLAVT